MRQLNLGQLIYELEKCEAEAEVRYDFARFAPDGIDSYRGFYEQLALGWKEHKITVGELLAICRGAVGETFTGRKGGDYTMHSETLVWVANPGDCHSVAVVGVTDCGWRVIINTAYMD